MAEIEKLDKKTRKIFTTNGMHHPRAENKNLICQLKKSLENEKMSKIANKPLHGKFFKHLEGAHINKELSVKWFTNGTLKREIDTRYHQRRILGQSAYCV